MTAQTQSYVILDSANGLLQWSGEASDEAAAFRAFGDEIGYSDDEPGVFERDAFRVIPVTAEQRNAVEAWAAEGADAAEYPL